MCSRDYKLPNVKQERPCQFVHVSKRDDGLSCKRLQLQRITDKQAVHLPIADGDVLHFDQWLNLPGYQFLERLLSTLRGEWPESKFQTREGNHWLHEEPWRGDHFLCGCDLCSAGCTYRRASKEFLFEERDHPPDRRPGERDRQNENGCERDFEDHRPVPKPQRSVSAGDHGSQCRGFSGNQGVRSRLWLRVFRARDRRGGLHDPERKRTT